MNHTWRSVAVVTCVLTVGPAVLADVGPATKPATTRATTTTSATARAATDPASLKAEVDRFVGVAVEAGYVKGCAVAVVTPGGAHVFGYGVVSDDSGKAPVGDTLFDIGSVTKGFTGLLLAQMAEAGEVAPSDSVEQFLPPGAVPPREGQRAVTLQDLARQRSGLPRMPGNFKPRDEDNPYVDYDARRLYAELRRSLPRAEPGERYEYSNLGAGLLGHLLSRRAGKPYEQLVVDRISAPLGMSDTRLTLSDERRRRLAAGHDGTGRVVPSWEFDVLAPAGGLRSTANDLTKFLAFASGPEPEGEELKSLYRALKRSIEPGADSVPGNRIGLFWMTSRRKGVVWHNGLTGGFHAYVAFVPGEQLGVAVLSNTAVGATMDDYAARLLLRLTGERVEPPAVRPEVAIDPATLDDYVGDYALAPIFFLNVRRQGDALTAQASLQPAFTIYPEGPDRFFYRAVDAQLRFERDASGKVIAVHLTQQGATLRGPRMKSATRPATTRSGGAIPQRSRTLDLSS